MLQVRATAWATATLRTSRASTSGSLAHRRCTTSNSYVLVVCRPRSLSNDQEPSLRSLIEWSVAIPEHSRALLLARVDGVQTPALWPRDTQRLNRLLQSQDGPTPTVWLLTSKTRGPKSLEDTLS